MCGVLAMQIHIHLTLVEKHMQIKVMQHFYPTYLLDLSLSLFLPFFPLPLPPSLHICAVVGGMAKKSRSVC